MIECLKFRVYDNVQGRYVKRPSLWIEKADDEDKTGIIGVDNESLSFELYAGMKDMTGKEVFCKDVLEQTDPCAIMPAMFDDAEKMLQEGRIVKLTDVDANGQRTAYVPTGHYMTICFPRCYRVLLGGENYNQYHYRMSVMMITATIHDDKFKDHDFELSPFIDKERRAACRDTMTSLYRVFR